MARVSDRRSSAMPITRQNNETRIVTGSIRPIATRPISTASPAISSSAPNSG